MSDHNEPAEQHEQEEQQHEQEEQQHEQEEVPLEPLEVYFCEMDDLFIKPKPKIARLCIVRDCLQLIGVKDQPEVNLFLVNRSKSGIFSSNNAYVLDQNKIVFRLLKSNRTKNQKILVQIHFLVCLIIHLLCTDGFKTKRDVYYDNPAIWAPGGQQCCDSLVEDIAASLGVERGDLHINASSKGLVIGPLSFSLLPSTLETTLTPTLTTPILIPNNYTLAVNAKRAIVVEKDATFEALINYGWGRDGATIIATGKGYPDVSTRCLMVQLAATMTCDSKNPEKFWQDTLDEFEDDGDEEYESLVPDNIETQSWDVGSGAHLANSVPDFSLGKKSLEYSQGLRGSYCNQSVFSQDESGPPSLSQSELNSQQKGAFDQRGNLIRVQVLVDCDPDGIEIMSVYKHGSRAMASHAETLACTAIEWIGVKPTLLFHLLTSMNPPPPSERLSFRGRKKVLVLMKSYIKSIKTMREKADLMQDESEEKNELARIIDESLDYLYEMKVLCHNGYQSEIQIMSIDQLVELVLDAK